MDIGLMALTQHPNDRDPARCMDEIVRQARAASDHGFASLFVGEHRFTDDIYFDNFTALARAAGAVRDEMLVGTSVCLLPLHHPGLVAERAATLDAITDGSFVLGAAAGYRDQEFATLGIDKDERQGRVTESVEVLRQLWTTEDATYDGEFYDYENVTAHPQPVQEPYLPIWLGGSAPAAVRRAANRGDAWLIDPVSTVEKLEKATGLYERELDEDPDCRPIRRDIYVAETTEDAVETAMPYLLDKYDSLAEWGAADEGPDDDRERFEAAREGRYLVGSPDDVVAELEELHDRIGVDHVVARVQWPGMAHETAMGALELLGNEVQPRVESI
ncbi:LLM class flavin-dependent oxidoreductase [Halorientalis litorea]|jgi:alkanesulfonate monooxygenase SsuD/methylene tetrahydromethanopterin reductase-like flavin-dependent oxidoreductase (luciferase family)|uniref:LLM class flavin-dependent oxidoreductase n=1 Tax=Halorientalis litorea TaxID=2931977 RepID=UPI001FF6423B|nr:LLM class flavin-dependent oxidoreductase [Halorientalis litorea]